MKKLIFFLLILLTKSICGQKYFNVSINGGAFSGNSFTDIYMITDETPDSNESCVSVRPFYAFQAGLKLNYYFQKNFILSFGFLYAYRYLDINLFPYNIPFIFTGTRLMLYQFPLQFGSTFFMNEKFPSLNFSGGINFSFYHAENQEFGKWINSVVMTKVIRDGFFYTLKLPERISTSLLFNLSLTKDISPKSKLNGGLYLDFPLNKNIGHELFYYKRIDTTVIADAEFTFYERDLRFGFFIEFLLPFRFSFKERIKPDVNKSEHKILKII